LKGAVDGGLHVPHNNQRFPGFFKDSEGSSYDASVHRDRIMGTHVDNYMAHLKDDAEASKLQFS
jgi:large subunit ribosomal protein L5e